MRVYLATKNAGKRDEFQALLAGTGIELLDFPGYRDVVEGEADYAENAALKARALREQLLSDSVARCQHKSARAAKPSSSPYGLASRA